MARIISDFSDSYIGIVYGYDVTSRELDVYIPKLMPAIPENRKTVETRTNLALIPSKYSVKYNNRIKLGSTIKVKAEDMNEPLPTIGSRVTVDFLDENPHMPYWSCWNYNGDYDVIESEKYPKYFNLKIDDQTIPVSNSDTIEILLPVGYTIMNLSNDLNSKHRTFQIEPIDSLDKRVERIEDVIGTVELTREFQNEYGKSEKEILPATGFYKMFKALESEIIELRDKVSKLEKK